MTESSEDPSGREPSSDELAALVGPPPVLYHYTSSGGLQGILETGGLWATDLRYLNDTNEYRLGRDRIVPAFREHVLKIDDSRTAKGILTSLVDHELVRNFYVTCFCEDGDSLGQWRGYAAPGGYALGFDTQVGTNAVRRPLDYRRVYYDGPVLESLVDGWARLSAEEFFRAFDADYRENLRKSAFADEFDVDEVASRLYMFSNIYMYRLELMSAAIKHHAFAEEREWRIIAGVYEYVVASPKPYFRQGPLGLTPYVLVDMKCDNGLLPLKEIIVGPGSNMELRVAAVKLMLDSLGYEDSVTVRTSEAPYRG